MTGVTAAVLSGMFAIIVSAPLCAQSPIPPNAPAVQAAPVAPVIRAAPAVQHIEKRDGKAINFDFIVSNPGPDTITLRAIELIVRDTLGAVVSRRLIDSNGFGPGIYLVPDRVWAPGATRVVFNPFSTFPDRISIADLHYTLRFSRASGDPELVSDLHVRPVAYRQHAQLTLPVSGTLLVYDGHDFYSHHRRMDYLHPVAQGVGISKNFMRYAYDFVRVDGAGTMKREGVAGNGAYFGFGEPVLAPAAGIVVAAVDVQPDNENGKDYFDPSKLRENPMSLYGNHVVIDHGNGEFSALGHMRRGSIVVQAGERVKQGDVVGQIGSSGSSFFPHLHYELRTGAGLDVEGLPSVFDSFLRVYGAIARPGSGAIDSGDFVRSTGRR